MVPTPRPRRPLWLSLPIGSRLAQPKEHALAPYPELYRVPDPFLRAELDEIIKYRPRESRFEAVSYQNIGCRFAVRSCLDAQRVVGSRRHKFVEIGPEDQLLVSALTFDRQLYPEEGSVFDFDMAALGRGNEPITAIRFTAQDGGEKLDERQAADGRPTIRPSAVASEPHVEIAAGNQRPLAGARGQYWRVIAAAAVFRQVCTCRRV